MFLEIKKLELIVREKDLNEMFLKENEAELKKNKISDFKIVLLENKIIVEGRKKIKIFKINFQIEGKVRILYNQIEFEIIKLKAVSFIPLSPAIVVKEIVSNNPPNVRKNKENSILIDVLSDSPYPLKINLISIEVKKGYIFLKALD